jgi:SH3 domain protein
MKYIFITLFLLSFVQTSYAYKAHVSDDLKVNLRTGPSLKYRLAGTLSSGDSFTVIDNKASRKFLKIKTLKGKIVWIAKSKTTTGESIKSQKVSLEESLSESVTLIKKQADEIHRLKALLSSQKIENERQTNTQTKLNSEINSLSNQIDKLDDSNLIRWFTHASIVTIIAIFLLFIASIFRKNRKYDEFY